MAYGDCETAADVDTEIGRSGTVPLAGDVFVDEDEE
jgi:hypothetical protein